MKPFSLAGEGGRHSRPGEGAKSLRCILAKPCVLLLSSGSLFFFFRHARRCRRSFARRATPALHGPAFRRASALDRARADLRETALACALWQGGRRLGAACARHADFDRRPFADAHGLQPQHVRRLSALHPDALCALYDGRRHRRLRSRSRDAADQYSAACASARLPRASSARPAPR